MVMWNGFILISSLLISFASSRSIYDKGDEEKSKGFYYFVGPHSSTNDDELKSLHRAVELPKLPLPTVDEVSSEDEDKDDMIRIDNDDNGGDADKPPLYDEFGIIITYPDKQLPDATDKREQQMVDLKDTQSKSDISSQPLDCIPRNVQQQQQLDEMTTGQSSSEEASVIKEAADELLSPVDDGLEQSRKVSSSNSTGTEIVEEPFILVTIRPLCPD